MEEFLEGTNTAKARTRTPATKKSKEILNMTIDFKQNNKILAIIKMIVLWNESLYYYL